MSLEDLRNRIADLRSARGVRRYYGDTFDDGVAAAMAQIDAWVASLDKPPAAHPDHFDRAESLADQANRVPPHLLRRLNRRDDE